VFAELFTFFRICYFFPTSFFLLSPHSPFSCHQFQLPNSHRHSWHTRFWMGQLGRRQRPHFANRASRPQARFLDHVSFSSCVSCISCSFFHSMLARTVTPLSTFLIKNTTSSIRQLLISRIHTSNFKESQKQKRTNLCDVSSMTFISAN
jgi:hypothetical protein